MTRRETAAKHEMIKSLVVLYGPREAARQLGLSAGTVTELAHRKGWRQATAAAGPSSAISPADNTHNGDSCNASHNPVTVSDAIAAAQRSHKQRSTAALGQFVAEAAEEALSGQSRLAKAKRVRDVAAIHTSLWPIENRPALLSVGILIGSTPVPDSARPIPGQILQLDRDPGPAAPELDQIDASDTTPTG